MLHSVLKFPFFLSSFIYLILFLLKLGTDLCLSLVSVLYNYMLYCEWWTVFPRQSSLREYLIFCQIQFKVGLDLTGAGKAYRIRWQDNIWVVPPPQIQTVKKTTSSVVENIIWRAYVAVSLIDRAKVIAPRSPEEHSGANVISNSLLSIIIRHIRWYLLTSLFFL